jgi:hypothetical protein
MAKTHYKISGNDHRSQGQSEFEYSHQTACGYVRESVTTNGDYVDCKWCLNSIHMINYHAINKTFSDSQGCY